MTLEEQFLTSNKRPPTEFEVQAECYSYLKTVFPFVRGEIKIQHPKVRGIRRERGARFDLVIYDKDSVPQFIIEVKRTIKYWNSKRDYYESLTGVPCYTVGSLEQCKQTIASLRASNETD